MPCTFQAGFCGWQTFANMSINGRKVTTTWKIKESFSWPQFTTDYSYLSREGTPVIMVEQSLYYPAVDICGFFYSLQPVQYEHCCVFFLQWNPRIFFFFILGKQLYLGDKNYRQLVSGRAAIISPRITKLSQLCSLVFFYRVGKYGRGGLSLYIQTG